MNPELQINTLSEKEKAAQTEMFDIANKFKQREYTAGNVETEHENAIKIAEDLTTLANSIHSITNNPNSEIFCVVEEGFQGVKIEVEGTRAIYEQSINNYTLSDADRENIVFVVHNLFKNQTK